MKNLRQSKLVEILSKQPVETQDDLQALLQKEGFQVTQATISRDIKELRIYKALSQNGKYRYALPSESAEQVFSARQRTLFRTGVTHIDYAQNIVVIKTLPGMASGACAAMDTMDAPMLVGSVAGDDTVFVAMRSEQAAKELMKRLQTVLL
jgi:transcriptional regulator of arginine metabolism